MNVRCNARAKKYLFRPCSAQSDLIICASSLFVRARLLLRPLADAVYVCVRTRWCVFSASRYKTAVTRARFSRERRESRLYLLEGFARGEDGGRVGTGA